MLNSSSCASLVTTAILLTFVHSSAAVTTDDLRCFKVKDPLKLKGVADVASAQAAEAGCKLKASAFVCVPAAATVSEAFSKKTPITMLPVSGSTQTDTRVCYKLSCPSAPVPQGVTDL